MNLTGRWKGKYKYGKGYPLSVVGKTEPFEFEIRDINGTITGKCNDLIVEAIEGNESTIEGVFEGDHISFLKKYKYNSFIEDESADAIPPGDIKFDGIYYTGKLYKKIFSKTAYFSGEWTIRSTYTDKENVEYAFTVEGSWTMTKVE